MSKKRGHHLGWPRRDTYARPFCETCDGDPCVCDPEAATAARNALLGRVIVTSYRTGPYRITKVTGPCACPQFLDDLEATWEYPAPRSQPHFHLTLRNEPMREGEKDHDYYLAGYRLDGTNVWTADTFTVVDSMPTQLELL